MRGSECGHVVATTSVEHGHHRGFQRRVLVVLLPGQARGPVEQVTDLDLRMIGHRRVVLRHRRIELEAPLAIGHAKGGGEQALGHRPGEVRRLRGGRLGIAFVDDLPIPDHQQRIGAHALAFDIVARGKSISLQFGDGGGRLCGLALPVGLRPAFRHGGAGSQAETERQAQSTKQGSAHGRPRSEIVAHPSTAMMTA